MNLRELHIKLDELRRQGHGNLNVYFRDGPIAYPILEVSICELLISSDTNHNIIVSLEWKNQRSPK